MLCELPLSLGLMMVGLPGEYTVSLAGSREQEGWRQGWRGKANLYCHLGPG